MKNNKKNNFEYLESVTMEGNIVMSENTSQSNKIIKKYLNKKTKNINLIDGLNLYIFNNLKINNNFKIIWVYNYWSVLIFLFLGIFYYISFFESNCKGYNFNPYIFIIKLILWYFSNIYSLTIINYLLILKGLNKHIHKKWNKFFIIIFQLTSFNLIIQLVVNDFINCIYNNNFVINLIIKTNFYLMIIIFISFIKFLLNFLKIKLEIKILILSVLYKLITYLVYFSIILFILFKFILFWFYLIWYKNFLHPLIFFQLWLFLYFLILLIIII